MTRRVVLLGLDSMDPYIARALADRGRAPTLARLWETSAWAHTVNPPGFVVGSVWPSIWTGVMPSRHGYYSNWQLLNGTHELYHASANDIDTAPFWGEIAAAGHRVSVLDMPITPLHEFGNCNQVVDWGTHDRLVSAASSPASALREIKQCAGSYAVHEECDAYAARDATPELYEDLKRGIEQKRLATLELLADPSNELVISVFAESHCAGHHLWPSYGSSDDQLADIYESLDRAAGTIIDATGTDTVVVVLLSHGMGAPYGGDHVLPEVLRRLDDQYGPPGRATSARERFVRPIARRRHERLLRRRAPDRHRAASRLVSVDSTRRFFRVPSVGLHSYVRFNVVGREPRGRVRRGDELERLVERLTSDLMRLVDPASGRPAITTILRTTDLYDGARIDDLPDLLVEWDTAVSTGVASDQVGELHGAPWRGRSGEHRPTGAIFATGPGIVRGQLDHEVRGVDIAPTIGALLGVSLRDVDGRVVDALIA